MVSSVPLQRVARVRTTIGTFMTSPIRFTVLSSTLLFTLQATADDAARNLDRVQVTGNRIAQAAGDAGHSITVLERADIEASRSIDVIDLLGKQTGIDVVRTGGSGSQNSIFIRGGNSNHALILIDGMRVNSATQGLFDFAHLPLALIERIEIVRGPRASVWGSDALSGVIQIFTRAPDSAHAEMRLGSYRRAGLDAGTGFSGKHPLQEIERGLLGEKGLHGLTTDHSLHAKALIDQVTCLLPTLAGMRLRNPLPKHRIPSVHKCQCRKYRDGFTLHDMQARRATTHPRIVHRGKIIKHQRGGMQILNPTRNRFCRFIEHAHFKADQIGGDRTHERARTRQHMRQTLRQMRLNLCH